MTSTTTLGSVAEPRLDPAAGPVEGLLRIDGEWREAADGGRQPVVDPATGRTMGTVAAATVADVDDAVAAARRAFDEGPWPRTSQRDRARVLLRAAALVRAEAESLAAIESQDVGKPIGAALAVDVGTAAEQFEYTASLAMRLDGEVRETPFPAHAYTSREPLGVVAAITPFNFPLILTVTKLAPALAMGNTVVVKPASDTPLSALRLVELLERAGLPAGVVNVVTGSGAVVGDALTAHAGIDKIAFTGSSDVGARIAERAGRALVPVSAELGGNGAHLLFADADLDAAIPAVIGGFLHNAGQFCMSGARLLVERSIHDEVLERLAAAVGDIEPGPPSDPATVLGPLVSAKQLAGVEAIVDRAVAGGARVVSGGARVERDGGFYYAPTILADVADDDEIVREEVFGPVLTVQPFDSEDEAVARANGTPFALAAGLQTTDIGRAHRVAPRLRAGMVWVNTWGLLDPAMPFGGSGASGFGRENGSECLAAYTHVKSTVFGL